MTLNLFRSSVCFVLMSFFNICTASDTVFGDDQPAEGTPPPETPTESRAMFAADTGEDAGDATAESFPQNSTFAAQLRPAPSTATTRPVGALPTAAPAAQASDDDTEEFVNVPKHEKGSAEFLIAGGMFDGLVIPISTMPYTVITLSRCTCQMPLDPANFQNNTVLIKIILIGSQLNFRHFEEKFGEGCPNLSHIDLQRTIDGSVNGYPIITPERFAQLAHPNVLQRILNKKCDLFISHPEHAEKCYTLEEMKEKFLSSILQLSSIRKAKETLSTYETLIGMLRSGTESIDPRAVATAGVNLALKACTGL